MLFFSLKKQNKQQKYPKSHSTMVQLFVFQNSVEENPQAYIVQSL